MKDIKPPQPRRADLRVVVDNHEEQRLAAIDALQRAKERIANDATALAQREAAIVRMTRLFIGAVAVAVIEAGVLVLVW
jgi:CHASE3 domain sensor protein